MAGDVNDSMISCGAYSRQPKPPIESVGRVRVYERERRERERIREIWI